MTMGILTFGGRGGLEPLANPWYPPLLSDLFISLKTETTAHKGAGKPSNIAQDRLLKLHR